jgi:uncharacterized membrane protein YphA (DoxX/SURF4 family)
LSRLLGALGGPTSALLFRLAVGGFFVAAALGKLSQPAEFFAGQIKAYGLAPEAWALPIARALPWVELFSGGLLLAGLFTGAAALAVAVQLGLFSAVLGVALALGKAPEDCGCIPGVPESPGQALLRDAAMLAWAALTARALPGGLAVDGWLAGSIEED